MAHFCKLGKGNIVEQVIVISNDIMLEDGVENEQLGKDFINNLYNSQDAWVQTSYNSSIRKNFAGIGFKYDETRDAFIPPKPFDSWTLNDDTCRWQPPSAYPTDGQVYDWNEENQQWDLV